ncbi:hypothetical protein CBER1_09081 [Cercospora berteroae]|uniref:Uncharacterized protein n=1 Tax=Cercospora berteroae TaxID=357750 RepID=A0A2S6C8W4_9PEZI|nr:hypothetical protein CBER1_09081 [Cercospora berteroae]
MSGAEVITAVQLIDACVGITRTIIEIGEAARDAKGLPDRLKELFERLPAIEDLLKLARENQDKVPSGDRESVEPVLKQCKSALEELRRLFWKACPEDGEHYSKRIWRGAKVVFFGRKSQLLILLDTILGNLKLLEQKKVYEIGGRLDSLSETIQTLAEDDSPMANNTHNGSGNQNILQGSGNMYNQGGGDHSTFHRHFAAPLTNTSDLCLQSLAFPDMETRGDIDPKTDQICEWISQHAKYLEWNRNGGLLWIKGRPGTGKSTLMEYLRKATPPDAGGDGGGETLVISFFFHRRGHELQKTPLGLFRSLLHQILRRDQDILSHLVNNTSFEARCRAEGEPGKGKRWDWTVPDLQTLFFDCVIRATKASTLRLYIDALDESGEKVARMLMEYLEQLHKRAGLRFEICVSCRPWPDVVHGWRYCIDVVEENAQDIRQLLRERLRKWLASSVEIEDEIASRAAGVFQWAVIVVERVLSLRKADTATILANIRDAPGNLDDIYHEMISNLIRQERKAALRLFRWIAFAKRPLSLTEIRHAAAIEANSGSRSSKIWTTSTHWCDNDEQMREKLTRLSSGLIRIVETNGSTTVHFDHESVQDYVLSRGISFLEETTSGNSAMDIHGRSEWILSSVCFRYLACPDIFRTSHEKPILEVPFATYSTDYCWIHASHAERQGHSIEPILMIGQWPEMKIAYVDHMPGPFTYLKFYSVLGMPHWDPSTGGAGTALHFAAYHGLSSIIKHVIPRLSKETRITGPSEKSADASGSHPLLRGRTPLWYAASRGHVSIVQLLLRARPTEVNTKDDAGVSPIWTAAQQGRYEVVSLLSKKKKVNVESKDKNGQTPLAIGASYGREDIVQLLLENEKVDVEAKDRHGSTPFWLAASNGQENVVRLLLKHGKVNPESRDNLHRSPLYMASFNGHENVVRSLLEHEMVNPQSMNLMGTPHYTWPRHMTAKPSCDCFWRTGGSMLKPEMALGGHRSLGPRV